MSQTTKHPDCHKMHVRKGDTVQVISGKDKGKVGEVLRAIPRSSKVVVKGVNVKTKHALLRKTKSSESRLLHLH
jgi:large subunit ribosomal protein L24